MLGFNGKIFDGAYQIFLMWTLNGCAQNEQEQLFHLLQRLLHGRLMTHGQSVRQFDDQSLLKLLLQKNNNNKLSHKQHQSSKKFSHFVIWQIFWLTTSITINPKFCGSTLSHVARIRLLVKKIVKPRSDKKYFDKKFVKQH